MCWLAETSHEIASLETTNNCPRNFCCLNPQADACGVQELRQQGRKLFLIDKLVHMVSIDVDSMQHLQFSCVLRVNASLSRQTWVRLKM